MRKRYLMCVGMLLGPLAVMAQEANVEHWTESVITPNFFIAVIAGVLLALGFQFILTALSVAAGISAIGDIKEKYVKGKYHPNKKDNLHDTEHDVTKKDDDDDDGMDTGTMITTGFGAWSVITTVLSLFGATALAINLALIASPIIAITLGLVIWATFFILLFYLESKIVNSLVGGLINTATAGLRASGDAVKSMFSSSKEAQMKNVAEDTIDKIRKDFSAALDPNAINDSIDEFFTRMDKTVPDYNQIKNDIKEIIEESDKRQDQTEKEAAKVQGQEQGKNQSSGGQGKWMAIQQVMTKAIDQASEGDSSDGQGKLEQLKTLQKELKEAYGEGDSGEEKLEKVIAKFTPAEEEQVKGYVDKIKQVLSKATPDEMDKNDINLQNKIMEVVKNPSVEGPKLASKLGEIDRDTIIKVLAANTALEKKQIEQYADKALEMIKKVTGKVEGAAKSAANSAGSTTDSTRGKVSGDISNGLRVEKKDTSDMQMKLEKEVFKMINHTGKPDINFSMLTSYLQNKFTSQGEGDTLENVKRKLKNFDKDSAMAIVTNNTNVDQKDIDKWLQSIEDAKQNVLDNIQKIEDEANRRVENVKRQAVIQAENTRKNAAAAAWWLVASALLSAGAAIGGSLLALA